MGRVFHHEIGKRHTMKMAMVTIVKGEENLNSINPNENVGDQEIMHFAPGEPLPPGFEDDIQKISQIQERLDNFKAGPLLGLEYLLEITEYDADKEEVYLCVLCDKRGDPRTVIAHLASYNHLLTVSDFFCANLGKKSLNLFFF